MSFFLMREMDVPAESWYKAIFVRRSRRSYSSKLPEEGKISHLEKVCQEFRPFREARAEFLRTPPDNVFKGVIGQYGKITGAPYYIAFIGDANSPNIQEFIGYTGEGIILEATRLGLHTCWVGGYFRPEIVRKQIAVGDDEKVFAVTPVGYALDKYTIKEKIFSGFIKARQRSPLRKLIKEGIPFSLWQEKALEAARRAPSAVNRQPWRFVVKENSIAIQTDSTNDSWNISKRLDCGIAMLHLELGALAAGLKGKWTFLSPPLVAKLEINL